ncbi:ion transporter [Alcaligenaceae bacterium LF4-65]|jgi:voltage-gated potassium channel|uniref:Ion transporter n=1 Tax=Zwartia hollandica TaxID=324606 RepID=A0A953N8S6_9BURK|nr:ion transporter [Zwartia hollandica]MBZ1350289.1 ion transporter [Zwartia hollandica]
MTITVRKKETVRNRLSKIVFESDTLAGRRFDKALLVAIVLSIAVVVLASVDRFAIKYAGILSALEWLFTIAFTLEYLTRVYCAPDRRKYVLSFFGIIDLLAIVPTYFALIFPELHSLIDVRVLRLIRIFRVFKLTAYSSEYAHLSQAFIASKRKILVFLSVVLMVVLVMGTLMYVIEGPEHGYTSIPTGIYWAITTMTTVGFGDIAPKTDLGRFLSSVMMLIGWGTLAVPTGIVTAEMSARTKRASDNKTCPQCSRANLKSYDRFCGTCGHQVDASSLAK